MVNFRWGVVNISLPKSENDMFTYMENYISTGDKTFRTKMRNAIESLEDSPEELAELEKELSSILEKVLNKPITPELKKEAEGWRMFSTKRDKSPNQVNLDFIEDKTLNDLTNATVLGRLKGTDVSFIRGGETKLPPFDFEDWYSALPEREKQIDVTYDVIFRENAKVNDVFAFAHRDAESALSAHMEASFPPFSPEGLANAKADYILEKTGQESRPKVTSGKYKITEEKIDYSFDVPDKVIDKLKGASNKNYAIEQELVENEEGESSFEPVGKRIPISSDPKNTINNINVQTALGNPNRTDKMKEEKIVQINDKYYSIKFQNVDEVKRVRLIFDEGTGNFEDFLEKNENMIMRVVKKFLDDPTSVYSVKLSGNIRTNAKIDKTYEEAALGIQAGENKVLTELGTNRRLSDEEIKEQSKRAFSHKTKKDSNGNKIFISEKEYAALSSEEKENYKSEIRVYEIDEIDEESNKPKSTGNVKTTDSSDYGRQKFNSPQIPLDDIKKVFKENAFVVLKIEVIKHFEFNLSGARGRQNRRMATHTNKLKKNIRKLKRIVGDIQ